MGSLIPFTIASGHLCVYILGSLLPLHLLLITLVAGPCAVFILFYWYIPKSPVWLVKTGKEEECKNVLLRLRGSKYDLEPEVKELQILTDITHAGGMSLKTLTSRQFCYPLFLLSSIFLLRAFLGTVDLADYSLLIFDYPGTNIGAHGVAIIFQLAMAMSTLPAPMLMSKFGRRVQLITGCVFHLICLLVLGAYHSFNLVDLHPLLAYTPIVFLILLGLADGLLVVPVAYTLAGELFPQQLKSYGSSIGISFNFFGSFIVLKLFPVVRGWLGMQGVYYIHSSMAVLLASLTFCLLPETRNKTYTELDGLFKNKSNEVKEIEAI